MIRCWKKPLYVLLIACYGLGITLGNILVLRELLNSGDQQYQLTSEKKSNQIPGTTTWTIKSFIPSTHQIDLSIHIASVSVYSDKNTFYRYYFCPPFQSKYTYLESLPSKPRDPPVL